MYFILLKRREIFINYTTYVHVFTYTFSPVEVKPIKIYQRICTYNKYILYNIYLYITLSHWHSQTFQYDESVAFHPTWFPLSHLYSTKVAYLIMMGRRRTPRPVMGNATIGYCCIYCTCYVMPFSITYYYIA